MLRFRVSIFFFMYSSCIYTQIDTARHFLPVSSILEVVDAMSYLKLNTLHLHLSDDDSFSFFVPAFPRLSATGSYSNISHVHSPADLKSIVAFARLRGVRIVPEFDTPAHFSTLVNAYPEYMASAGEQVPAALRRALVLAVMRFISFCSRCE